MEWLKIFKLLYYSKNNRYKSVKYCIHFLEFFCILYTVFLICINTSNKDSYNQTENRALFFSKNRNKNYNGLYQFWLMNNYEHNILTFTVCLYYHYISINIRYSVSCLRCYCSDTYLLRPSWLFELTVYLFIILFLHFKIVKESLKSILINYTILFLYPSNNVAFAGTMLWYTGVMNWWIDW